jgi:hypothetical protein
MFEASGTQACFDSQYMFAVGVKILVSSRVPAQILIRPVSSLYIMMGEPQSRQNVLCNGSPVVPPGWVQIIGSPVTATVPVGTPMTMEKADPVKRWQSLQ